MVSLMQLPDFAPQQRRQSLLLDLAPINQGIGFAAQENQRAQSNARADRQMQLAENADKRAASSETRQAKAFDNSQEDRQIANLAAMVRHVADDPNPQTRTANYQRIVSTPQMAERLAKAGVDTSNMDATLGFLTTKINAYMSPQQRERERLGIEAQRGQIANQGLDRQIKQRALNTPPDDLKILPPGSTLVRTPKGGQAEVIASGAPKPRSSTELKAIYEAQDELPQIQGALETLKEAKTLLPSIYTGFGAQTRSAFNQGASEYLPNLISDPKRAAATQRYNQIMTAEAISAMSQQLKGATTDREMANFISIINDPNTGPDTKLKAIEQMERMAQRHLANKTARLNELGGRVPGSEPSGGALKPGNYVFDPATGQLRPQ